LQRSRDGRGGRQPDDRQLIDVDRAYVALADPM
jgi:hypothetical protein